MTNSLSNPSQAASPASGIGVFAEKLLSLVLPDGGLPYYRGGESSAEPTILAALALNAAAAKEERLKPLLACLRGLQNPDGSVGIGSRYRDQGLWLTAPAAIVFRRFGLEDNLRKAIDFLLATKSVTLANNPRFKQDNTLLGWPWVRGTFGWVEPTAWAVLGLVLSGNGAHPRANEGRRLIWDREIGSGGWNYGSPELDDTELLPFWDTTGLALVALREGTEPAKVRKSLDLLEKNRGKIESLRGLAWVVLALEAYGRDARALRAKLREVMASAAVTDTDAANFALGTIALSGKKVFIP
ncbi:MAG: hypothetical protein ACYDH0_07990 [Candidatus Aminicenantales bacterium]